MFSNLGNGIGRITYAPVTNFGTTSCSKMPEIFERWLTKGLNEEETKNYGQRIIDGVASYIPAMKEAKLIQVIPGIVKSKGEVDINDKNSAFHKRDYDGVAERQIGFVENAAIKLYCLSNARKTADLIEKQRLAKEDIREIIDLFYLKLWPKKARKEKHKMKRDSKKCLPVICSEMSEAINNLIELHQSENSDTHLTKDERDADITKIVKRSVKLLEAIAEHSNVTLVSKIEDTLYQLSEIDPKKVKQIIINLTPEKSARKTQTKATKKTINDNDK